MNSQTPLRNWLERPVDIAPLVYFRIIFGGIMIWEVLRYFSHGWITKYFVDPPFLAKYYLFEWVQPLPADGMYALFVLLALSALCIMLGLWYRFATVIFFVGFSYMFLLDASRYLNHFYLVSLVSFLLIFIPAHGSGSLDIKFYPGLRRESVPAWALYLILFQLGCAYFFGGIAKITPDWLHGEPIGQWLRDRADLPVLGEFFKVSWAGYFFAYGGMLLDLLLVPLMLVKRTRPYMYGATVAFHLLNSILFSIGIFPWFMLGATLMFFPARHFRYWLTKLGILSSQEVSPAESIAYPQLSSLRFNAICLFVAWQVVMPLRHFALYSSNPSWSDEGHRFAWHMKLRDKNADLRMNAYDGDSVWHINVRNILRPHQYDQVASTPDLLVDFAQYIGKDFQEHGHPHIKIKVQALAGMNGRESQLLIDTSTDLMTIKRSLAQASWIYPLQHALPTLALQRPSKDVPEE